MCHIKEGEVLLAVARARLTQAADKYSHCKNILPPTNQIKCKSPFSSQEFIKHQHSNILRQYDMEKPEIKSDF